MKIIFFNVPSTGHVDPSLSLAAELVGRGHQLTYYLTPAYRERVEATGANFRETPGVPDDYFDEVSRVFNPMRLATQLLETTYALLPALLSVVEEEGPDVILYDSMCPWGRSAAAVSGIPAVASMSLLELPPSYLVKSGQLLTPLKLAGRFLPWIRSYRRAAHRLEDTYRLKIPSFPGVINWPGDLNISYTAAVMNPQAEKLRDSYLFVGPPMPDGLSGVDFPFEDLDPDRPLIYVSLGTVFNDNPDFFRRCIKAFAGSDYQVVISLGKGLPVDVLGEIPANVIVRPYVPQIEILERASLYITHGGVNSAHHGLYHGVPLLLVPQQLEQALVAARIAELGAGLLLRKESVDTMRAAAQRLLEEPAFRRRAADLGRELKAAGGVERAAEGIEKLGIRT